MRVIAGTFRGRQLRAPRGSTTRPTSDRVREALFSILGDVEGAHVLDLFAGTGALGIEALSRGAASAVFVERDRHALFALRANLGALGLQAAADPDVADPGMADPHVAGPHAAGPGIAGAHTDTSPRVQVRAHDASKALQAAVAKGEVYDLVFVDPPYGQAGAWAPRLDVALPQVLAPEGVVVVESDRRVPLLLGLPVQRQRRYGDTSITIHSHS
jgi:16S rRNA (guanine966-N2)-methyltransferase